MLPTVWCCYGDSLASLPPSDSSGSWFLLVCCPVFYGFNFSFLLALKQTVINMGTGPRLGAGRTSPHLGPGLPRGKNRAKKWGQTCPHSFLLPALLRGHRHGTSVPGTVGSILLHANNRFQVWWRSWLMLFPFVFMTVCGVGAVPALQSELFP